MPRANAAGACYLPSYHHLRSAYTLLPVVWLLMVSTLLNELYSFYSEQRAVPKYISFWSQETRLAIVQTPDIELLLFRATVQQTVRRMLHFPGHKKTSRSSSLLIAIPMTAESR